jgi:hypothetical protein
MSVRHYGQNLLELFYVSYVQEFCLRHYFEILATCGADGAIRKGERNPKRNYCFSRLR